MPPKNNPSYKESLNYDVDTAENLNALNQQILEELNGEILRVNTENTHSTARIYYEQGGKSVVVDGIADGQPVKVLGHKTINGESYLKVGYNLKPDGSYKGEGFMKPQILHQPKKAEQPMTPEPPKPDPNPILVKPMPKPVDLPITPPQETPPATIPERIPPSVETPEEEEEKTTPEEREEKIKEILRGAIEYQKKHKIPRFKEALHRFELETESSLDLVPVETKNYQVEEDGVLAELYGASVHDKQYTYYELDDFNIPSLEDHKNASGLAMYGNVLFINKSKSTTDNSYQSTVVNEVSHAITHEEFPELKRVSSENQIEGFESPDLPNWRIGSNVEADEFLSDVASLNTYPSGEIQRIIANGIYEGESPYNYNSTNEFMRQIVVKITQETHPEIKAYLENGTEIPGRTIFVSASEWSIGYITGVLLENPEFEKEVTTSYMRTGKALVKHLRKQKETA